MYEIYDTKTAYHYAAFRPPLHKMILDIAIKDKKFNIGLDIGCGTGYSTEALSKYCEKVHGIDPSHSMLKRTTGNDKINYMLGEGKEIPLPNNTVDIVTLAGSLFYAKSAELTDELKRVCLKNSLVIPYDFEILLDDILLENGITQEKADSDYDHEINFSDDSVFTELWVNKKQISLELTSEQTTHLLLGDSNIYNAFSVYFNENDPYKTLLNKLESKGNDHKVKANIYYSIYKINTI